MTDNGGRGRGKTRLLMSNEPRAYREVIAEALRELRPHVEIVSTEPEDLDETILKFEPDMVICSAATETLKKRVLVWIELYKDFGSQSMISVEGRTSSVEEIQLSELLSVVDRTEQLLKHM